MIRYLGSLSSALQTKTRNLLSVAWFLQSDFLFLAALLSTINAVAAVVLCLMSEGRKVTHRPSLLVDKASAWEVRC